MNFTSWATPVSLLTTPFYWRLRRRIGRRPECWIKGSRHFIHDWGNGGVEKANSALSELVGMCTSSVCGQFIVVCQPHTFHLGNFTDQIPITYRSARKVHCWADFENTTRRQIATWQPSPFDVYDIKSAVPTSLAQRLACEGQQRFLAVPHSFTPAAWNKAANPSRLAGYLHPSPPRSMMKYPVAIWGRAVFYTNSAYAQSLNLRIWPGMSGCPWFFPMRDPAFLFRSAGYMSACPVWGNNNRGHSSSGTVNIRRWW